MFKLKRVALKLVALGFGAAPIALVVSCHKYGVEPTLEITNFSAQNLRKISLTGDTRNVVFNVPTELTHYDPNTQELSEKGSDTVFYIYAQVRVNVGGVPIEGANKSFMPLDLLQDYLAGRLSYVSGTLTLTKNAKVTSVQSLHGGTFNFTPASIDALTNAPIGEWKTDFTFRYQVKNKVSIKPTTITEPVLADATQLKTYVTLDRAFENDAVQYAAFKARWAYDASSVNDNVNWTYPDASTGDLPSSWIKYVSGVRFAAGSINDEGAVLSIARPNVFPAQSSKRALFMELTPTPGYALSFTKYDMSSAIQVQDLVTRIDLLDEYKNADLSKVKLSALNGRLAIDQSAVVLPAGSRLEYQLTSGGTWFLESELNAVISNSLTLSPSDFQARLETTDNKKFVITDRKETKPDVSAILGFNNTQPLFASAQSLAVDLPASEPQNLVWKNQVDFSTYAPAVAGLQYLMGDFSTEPLANAAISWSSNLPTALNPAEPDPNFWMRLQVASGYLVSQLTGNLSATTRLDLVVPTTDVSELETEANKLRADGVHNAVTWNVASVNLPEALVNAVEAIEFTSGEYATQAEAERGTFNTALPTSTAFDFAKRHIWMRLTPKSGAKISKRYFDLTSVSGIGAVKSLVDAQDTYTAVNLANIKVAGPISALTIDDSVVTLPIGAKLTYSFKATDFASGEEIKTYFRTNAASITPADFATLKARLQVTDEAKYVLQKAKEVVLSTANVTINLDKLPDAAKTNLDNILANSNTVHSLVFWIDQSTYVESVRRVLFLSGKDYTTLEAVIAAPESAWNTKLPNNIAYEHEDRNLWAKVEAAAPYVFANNINIVNITNSSKIRQIKSKINDSPLFADLDLSKLVVVLSSATATPVIEETAVGSARIAGSRYEFSYKQENGTDAWLSEPAFIAEATNNPVFLALTSVKVHLVNADPSKYAMAGSSVKPAIVPIAFRYDRSWTYKVVLIDVEDRASQIGNFNFYTAGYKSMTKEAVSNFTTNNPQVTLDYFALWGSSTLSIAKTTLEMNFVSTEFYTSFRSRYAGLGYLTQEWYYDINIAGSYIMITGDYTNTPTKYVFEVNPVHQNDSPRYGAHYIWVDLKKG